jgi:Cu/Zn superoxide dismutase
MKYSMIAAAALAGFAFTGCTTMNKPKAESYTATLAASPGVTTSGKGTGAFTYAAATHTLTYTVKYEGLTGPALAAHIHGPADPGGNAPPVVPFANAASPITGTATLTDAQAADLKAGKYYVNVHTAANKGGEIRGQIVAKK